MPITVISHYQPVLFVIHGLWSSEKKNLSNYMHRSSFRSILQFVFCSDMEHNNEFGFFTSFNYLAQTSYSFPQITSHTILQPPHHLLQAQFSYEPIISSSLLWSVPLAFLTFSFLCFSFSSTLEVVVGNTYIMLFQHDNFSCWKRLTWFITELSWTVKKENRCLLK